jgi:DNA-binding beta-propeller fold protein YncE
MKRSPFLRKILLALLSAGLLLATNVFAAESEAGEAIPTGKKITPTAAPGSTFERLNPGLSAFPNFVVGQAVTTTVSPDGNTLLILTSGYNLNNDSAGNQVDSASTEYVFVYDISVNPPQRRQVLQVPNTFQGLVFNPNGTEFYVSGGPDDLIRIFDKSGSDWVETATVMLGHINGVGLGPNTPMVAGLAVTQDGKKLIAANYRNESVSVVDLVTRSKTAELDLRPGKLDASKSGVPGGEYPFWVAIKGNSKAYVSSMRDREVVVLDITSPTPTVLKRIPLKGQPNKMIFNRSQSLLFVATDLSDSVNVIDSTADGVMEEIAVLGDGKILARLRDFKGSNPNSLALSPDERTLYVTQGGTNSVAVIRLSGGNNNPAKVVGLIPTGWYPNSVSLNRNGSILFVVNGKSNAGPNSDGCTDKTAVATLNFGPCNAANQYVWQLTKAGFSVIPTPPDKQLDDLTQQVAEDNDFSAKQEDEMMNFLRTRIKHVIFVVKENRTYDQILGDLEKGNGDPSIVVFPEPISPNHHQLARQFVALDNFFDTGEVSGDGWNWTTQARTAVEVEKAVPVIYGGRGTFTYDFEGTNRNINTGFGTVAERQAADPLNPGDPDILPGTADVSAFDGPDGEEGAGYLWDAALRGQLSVRNYGFFIDLTRYSLPAGNPFAISPTANDPLHGSALGSTVVAFPTKQALQSITDPFFRGFDQKTADFWRFKEWEREFDQFVKNGNLPNLELVRIEHDHFGSFGSAVDGVNTFATQMADNDYALGLIVDKVSHSTFKNSTLIFVVEDDAQDGPDHVDAHRSIAYVVGPFVKQGELVSNRFTTVNMLRTIVDVLGIKPIGLNDATAAPMSEVFQMHLEPWTYSAIVPDILRTTSLPLPVATARKTLHSSDKILAMVQPQRDNAAHLTEQTKGMDFASEDHLNAALFNRVMWRTMKGDVPYPVERSGQNLGADRKRLLQQFKRLSPTQSSANVVSSKN